MSWSEGRGEKLKVRWVGFSPGLALWQVVLIISIQVCVASVSQPSQAPATAPQMPNANPRMGIALLQQKRYEEAKEEFLRLTRTNPKSAEAFYYLGVSEMNLEDLPNAKDAFLRSLQLNPHSENAHYNLGLLLLAQKRPKEAITHFEEAAKLGPQQPESFVKLVQAYLDAGEKERALRSIQSTQGRFEDNPAFQLALGKCLLSHNLPDEAQASLEKANHLVPSQPDILLPLADVYLHQKDTARASEVLASIEGRDSHLADYHYMRARLFFLSERKEDALQEINLASQMEPQNPIYLLTAGRFYQKYGDQQKALSVLERAAQLAPDLAEIPYSISVSYFITDDFDQAANFSARALQIDPAFDRALFLLGIGRFAQGNFVEAERSLTRALTLKPRNPFHNCFFGMLLISENRLDEALWYLQKTLTIDPSYPLAHYELGRVLERSGKYEEARAELERAIELQPDLPEAYYVLGQVYMRLGEGEKADRALAIFKKYRAVEYSERREILKQVQKAVQDTP
jgi:tetratricopeptide (TPR) repeat protein